VPADDLADDAERPPHDDPPTRAGGSSDAGRALGTPRPVPADEGPAIRARRNQPPPLPPSTPAAQRHLQADDQLTTRLERED
jgi:hypothetical protein